MLILEEVPFVPATWHFLTLDRAMISRLENGQLDNPTIATMTRYAKALGQRVLVSLVDAEERIS